MNSSSPTKLILASMAIVMLSLKIKEHCYYCFLGAIFVGFLFLIFGIYKYIKQQSWQKRK